jgi:small subunit ribosomal protein S4
MGDPKKQRKKFDSPKYPWSKDRVESELRILGDYGLRNKRELWRHRTELSKYRAIARELRGRSGEDSEQKEKQLLSKLFSIGLILESSNLDNALDLTIRDVLERRLQTIVFRQGLAKTPHQARQLIVHGHISIKGKKITTPSYIVKREEETEISYSPTSPFSKKEHIIHKELSSLPPVQ